eukprot:m51a1_g754 putative intraflagellar transport 74 homolog (580) ;mRNA; r:528770-530640
MSRSMGMGPPPTGGGVGGSPSNSRPGTASMRAGLVTGSVARKPAVSSHGVPSSSYGAQAPGRAVQDRNFYLGQVRAKMAELQSEMDAMNREIDHIGAEQRDFQGLQRRHAAIQDEVARQQQQLTDHNVLLDKLRTTPDITAADLRAEASRLAQANEVDRQKADLIFAERTKKEREIAEAERRIQQLREAFQQELGRMGEERRNAYFTMKQENEELKAQVRQRRGELDALTNEAARLEAQMKGDTNRQKALGLYEEMHKLRKKREQLMTELNASQLSIPEERERLLQHIKLTNQAIASISRSIADTEAETAQLRQQMEQMEVEMRESTDNREKREKLAEAQKKEAEFAEFLEKAPAQRQELSQQKTKIELTILALLEHISKRLVNKGAAPASEKAKEMQDDLVTKEVQVKDGEVTQEKLQQVLEQRRAELEKMENMDQKITAEIESFKERTVKLQQELQDFAMVGKIREEIDKKKKRLDEDKVWVAGQKEIVGIEAGLVESDLDQLTKQINETQSVQQLEIAEKQLRQLESTLFTIREYVESRRSESDYKPILADVVALVADINKLVCDGASMPNLMAPL